MSFSEREGHKKPKQNPLESMDNSLKMAIWNDIYKNIKFNHISLGTSYGDDCYKNNEARKLWTDFFEKNLSKLPGPREYLDEIENLYSKLAWNEVYDLIEYFLNKNQLNPSKINKVLTKHNAAYRIINSIVQPITNTEVVNALELAANNAMTTEIKVHLEKAELLYSNKKNPDFNNSCLESIKAVEGTCRLILKNEKILGDNVKEIKHSTNHNKHIAEMLEKLNAFRNDVPAHATKKDGYIATKEDSILIHTICCGFINYFKYKEAK